MRDARVHIVSLRGASGPGIELLAYERRYAGPDAPATIDVAAPAPLIVVADSRLGSRARNRIACRSRA